MIQVFAVAVALLHGESFCNEMKPNEAAEVFCDGGIQNACANILEESECTGRRKDRKLVAPNCIAGDCNDHCENNVQECWTEYVCVWQNEKCKNGIAMQSGQISAPYLFPCTVSPDCED